jgi:hypothetical protein
LSADLDKDFNEARRVTDTKPSHVMVETSGIDDKQGAEDYLKLLTKQYPDLIMSNPRMDNKGTLTFDILSMLDEQDIKYKLEEFFAMFKSPFNITNWSFERPREATEKPEGVNNVREAISAAAISAAVRKAITHEVNKLQHQGRGKSVGFSDNVQLSQPWNNYRDNVSAADELRKLASLKDDGVITDEEFQQMKQAVIKKALKQSV